MLKIKKAQKAVDEVNQEALPDADNVDRIRDIIFGTQMRDYEQRFRALEERLGNAIDSLREEMIGGLKERNTS